MKSRNQLQRAFANRNARATGRRRQKSRILAAEHLEDRRLLTGNVTAMITDGDLVIHGSNMQQAINITESPSGQYVISAIDGSTTINGDLGPVALSGVTDDVIIDLGDGGNRIELTSVSVPDDLQIRSGKGENVVNLSELDVGGDVSVSLRSRYDGAIAITDCVIGNDLSVVTRKGDDEMIIVDSTVGGSLWASAGDGDDTVDIHGVTVEGLAVVATSAGEDHVCIEASNFGFWLSVALGPDDDRLDIGNSSTGRLATFSGGLGHDTLADDKSNSFRFQLPLFFEEFTAEIDCPDPGGPSDTTPPTITANLFDDTGSSDADLLTSNPTIVGNVTDDVAVASLVASVDGGPAVLVSRDNLTGDFTFTAASLSDGEHDITFTARDAAGNSASLDLTFTLLTQPPPAPQFELSAGSVAITATASDTTDAATVSLVGTSGPNLTIHLLETGVTTVSSNTGFFQIPEVPVMIGDNTFTAQAVDLAGNSTTYQAVIHRTSNTGQGDPVLQWVQASVGAIQLDATPPPMASRALAMVSTAIFDAVASVEGKPAYYVSVFAPDGASVQAAVSAAADEVLRYLYPAQANAFDTVLDEALALVPDGQAETDGVAVGRQVADAIIALRASDGWNAFVDYVPGSGPGVWQPTPPAYALALLPQWATLTPFAMTSDSQFRPSGPPDLTSQEWADAFDDVKSLGAADSTTRTPDQTEIARFWADGGGTYTPPGHWNQIAQEISAQQGLSLDDNARLFAELNTALGDAAIVAWDAKYGYEFWRPITAIAAADTDENDLTTAQAGWTPLLISPNFPEYVSGHSTFSGTAAGILDAYFGNDYAFSSTSEFVTDSSGPVTRSFASFDAAAEEAGRSRIYGGVHFEFSNQDGLAGGHALADYVIGTFSISTDSQAPRVFFDDASQQVANQNVVISGHVLDNLTGVTSLEVQIDDGDTLPVAFDVQGHFSFATELTLDGSDDGTHDFAFRAIDAAGNASTPLVFSFTLATEAPIIDITAPADNELTDGALLTGTAFANHDNVVALSYAFDGGVAVPIDPSTGSFSVPLDLSHLTLGPHDLTVSAMDQAGNTSSMTVHTQLSSAIPLALVDHSPSAGAAEIGLTYHPKIVFSRPVDTSTLNGDNFYATDTTGARLAATITPANDGSFAWLFFADPMPGASMITVTVDGATIHAADGTALDADGDGTPGGVSTFTFTTVSQATVPNTSLSGIVADPGPDLTPNTFDDVRPGPDGLSMTADDVYLYPIEHVKVFILGHEDQFVYTDANGHFSFASVPTGDIKFAVDGRTAVDTPSGVYFPEMVMDLHMTPGVANTVMAAMQPTAAEAAAVDGVLGLYLPRLQTSLLHTVTSAQATVIGVNATSAPNLTPAQRQLLSIEVLPDSLVGADGQKLTSAQIGISTVPPQLVVDMLPAGLLQHTFDITVQSMGATNFSTPAPMTFPNVFNAAPGTKLNFLSFDHTTGRLVIEGTATVSADGLSVHTDPGTGITHPGWHGLTGQGVVSAPEQPDQYKVVEVSNTFVGDIIEVDLHSALPTLGEFTFQSFDLGDGTIAEYDGWIDELRNHGIFDFVPGISAETIGANTTTVPSIDTVQLKFSAIDFNSNAQINVLVEFKDLSAGDIFRRGYSSIKLMGSVGNDLANNPLDVYRLQQRLKFLGFRAQGGDVLAVDGKWGAPTESALKLFQATVDPTGQANPLSMSGQIIKDDTNDHTLAWLNATNAPRWIQLEYPSSLYYVKDGSQQTERWGTDWSIQTVESAGAGTQGRRLTINGISTIDGYGSSKYHHEHQAGMDIDVNIAVEARQPGNATEQNILKAVTDSTKYNSLSIITGPLTSAELKVVDDMLGVWHNVAAGARVSRILVSYQRIVDEFNRRINLEMPGVGDIAQVDYSDGTPHWNHFHVDLTPPEIGISEPLNGVNLSVVGPDPGFGSDPRLYYRIQPEGGTAIAGRSADDGQFSVFLPANTAYTATYYQASTNQAGVYHGHTNASGTMTNLGTIVLDQFGGQDSDNDGIPDVGELAIGTNPLSYSTTGDGIGDGAKIAVGIDPLGGRLFATGVVAKLSLAGESKEVVLTGSTLDPAGQTAFVATGSYGLAIVDASRFQTPIVLSQLDFPGDATDVAVDTRLGIAAVACNAGGLQLVDVTNPGAPRLIRTLNVDASQVEVADGIAYVAVGSALDRYDLLTGERLQSINLGGGMIGGLAREGAMLYTTDNANVLRAIDISSFQMVVRGSMAMPAGGGKLFVGGGIAYVSAEGRGFPGGFATADVSDADNFALLSGVDAVNLAGRAIAANGSGIAVTVGNPAGLGNLVQVLDVSDPTNTGNFITQFTLGSVPLGVAIGAGIAYIADGSGGLQVVNYLPFDNQGAPPTVDVSMPSADIDPGTAGIQVLEGSTISVQATVADDVQVRNVELLVNGEVVQNAVSFPFNLSLVAPTITPDANTFTVQTRATDSGGNVALSDVVIVDLVSDTSPPTILGVVPVDNSTQVEPLPAVRIYFSKAMAANTINSDTIRLRDLGGDYVAPTSVQLRDDDHTAVLAYTGLGVGEYELVISAPQLTDRAGNALGTEDVTSSFALTPRAALTTNVTDVDPSTPDLQVFEGTTIPISVNIVTGVSVENVALFADGELVGNETTGPFDFAVIAPNITPGSDTLTVTAQVTDTGGFTTETSITIGLREDDVPPTIIASSPADGGMGIEGPQTAVIRFSEPMSMVVADDIQVRNSSGDLTTPINFFPFDDNRSLQLEFPPLAAGDYDLIIHAASFSDRAGNPLGTSDIVSSFTLTPRAAFTTTIDDIDPVASGLQVFDGTDTVPITVEVDTKVDVQDVNLFVDGQFVATATTAPFQFSVGAPSVGETITVTANVTDVSGFVTTTDDYVIETLDTITVSNTQDSGPGSLRQAILDANTSLRPVQIRFEIQPTDPNVADVDSNMPGGDPDPDVGIISPLSPLPRLNNPNAGITIDGRTQRHFTGNSNPFGPVIVLDGSLAGDNVDGLTILSSNNTIAGLNIQNFHSTFQDTSGGTGVAILGGSNNEVDDNYIGTDATGTIARPNWQFGVMVTAGSDNAIYSNLISGNWGTGVWIKDGASHNYVNDNKIGVDRTATVAIGNGGNGVYLLDSADDTVAVNIISGNGNTGVTISASDGTDMYNNYIGTDGTGRLPIGNAGNGISIREESSNTRILGIHGPNGDPPPLTDDSIIAFNAGIGVRIGLDESDLCLNNTIESTYIFGNSDLPVDLASDGMTANDEGDQDAGPNGLQNFPVLRAIMPNTGFNGYYTRFVGNLHSLPNTEFRLEFTVFGPSGYRDTDDFEEAYTDALGVADFDLTVPLSTEQGSVVMVSATGPTGTSEFFTTTVSEVDDTIGQAIDSGLSSTNYGSYSGHGFIGDSPLAAGGRDVDMVAVQLGAGDRLTVDVDSNENGEPFDGYVRVFDSAGVQVAANDNRPAPGEIASSDPYVDFSAPTAGTYYVGFSGASNNVYDPFVPNSGTTGSVGYYEYELTVGASADAKLLFSNGGSVSVIDTSTGTVTGTQYFDSAIGDIAVTADGAYGFAGDLTNHVIWVMDLTGPAPALASGTNMIPISTRAGDMAITVDQQYLLVGNNALGYPEQGLSVVNISTRSLVTTYDPGYVVSSVETMADGTILLGSSTFGIVESFFIDELGNLSPTGYVLVAASPRNVVGSSDGNYGIVVDEELTFPLLISFTNIVLQETGTSGFSEGEANSALISPSGDRVYQRVHDQYSGLDGRVDVYSFNGSTGEIGATPLFSIPITAIDAPQTTWGIDAQEMALSADGVRLYVLEEGALNVYDAASGVLINSIVNPVITSLGAIVAFNSLPTESAQAIVRVSDTIIGANAQHMDAQLLLPPSNTYLDGDPNTFGETAVAPEVGGAVTLASASWMTREEKSTSLVDKAAGPVGVAVDFVSEKSSEFGGPLEFVARPTSSIARTAGQDEILATLVQGCGFVFTEEDFVSYDSSIFSKVQETVRIDAQSRARDAFFDDYSGSIKQSNLHALRVVWKPASLRNAADGPSSQQRGSNKSVTGASNRSQQEPAYALSGGASVLTGALWKNEPAAAQWYIDGWYAGLEPATYRQRGLVVDVASTDRLDEMFADLSDDPFERLFD